MDGLRRPLLLTWSIDRGVGGLCQLAATSDILNPNLGCGPAGYGRVRYTACADDEQMTISYWTLCLGISFLAMLHVWLRRPWTLWELEEGGWLQCQGSTWCA